MKNNILDKIKMQTAKLPSERFNMANDVSYTTQFGCVTPTHVRYMHAGTKKVVNDERLHYLAPLVVPTFSRLKEKIYHHFVPLTDLLPKSGLSRLVNEPFSAPVRGGVAKSPHFPWLNLRFLSCFALFGSRCCVWYGDQVSTASSPSALVDPPADTTFTALYKRSSASQSDNAVYTLLTTPDNLFFSGNGLNNAGTAHTVFSNTSGNQTAAWSSPTLNAFGCNCPSGTILLDIYGLFGSAGFSQGHFLIPLGQQGHLPSFCTESINNGNVLATIGEDPNFYDLEHSDVVIPWVMQYKDGNDYKRRRFFLCFHLSDYGKRFKNWLEGCGYGLHFGSDERVAALPLFAEYKAYYDQFAINLFENFENSELGYVLNSIDSGAFDTNNCNLTHDLTTCSNPGATARLFASFGETFYTEEVDYLASHTANNAISNAPNPNMIMCDVDYSPHITTVDSSTDSTTSSPNPHNGHAYIDNPVHGQLDAEFLMKALRWVNRNSIAGQRIAELLRAQGFGDYVDTCKSNFIGYDETPLVINDVISSSDTYQAASGEGAQLGQRGAKGIGYNDGKKTFTFEANEIGFWVTLSVIVPASGYCQGIDPVNSSLIHKDNFYQPDFDSLGMQETTMLSIVDSPKSLIKDDGSRSGIGFGFTPRMSHFKVSRNKLLGGFSLPSEQDNWLPYVLDKFIPLNKLRQLDPISTVTDSQGNSAPTCRVINPVDIYKVPTAGVAWRYVGKYLYIENFNRMFSYKGASSSVFVVGNNWSEFCTRDSDNFIVHLLDNDQTYAHMKLIEESFETDDDGKFNSAMDKA